MKLLTRAETIKHLSGGVFDVVVVGGGIHGVTCAKLLASTGLRTALLEKYDYASGTSSRSSKMAHGGLRYLEMFDFEQVSEGIRAREELFERCSNMVRPEQFLIPVPRGAHWFRFKLGVGLSIYDSLVRSVERKHSWISREELNFPAFARRKEKLAGCYRYTDGLMSDARLVFAMLNAAIEKGAICANYLGVESIVRHSDSTLNVTAHDSISQRTLSLSTKLVLNCAGPWAPFIREESEPPVSKSSVRYSRGIHLVFSTPWRQPSLFLPLPEKGRYYFVWPHASGTMVGTTEREVSEVEADPQPRRDEIDEVLSRLARDLPDMGLDRSTLHYAFAGVRTLPLRTNKKGVSALSRKHQWHTSNGVISLLGGKYTTFAWTAHEGVTEACAYLDVSLPKSGDALLGLRAALSPSEHADAIESLVNAGRSELLVRRALSRIGGYALDYIGDDYAWEEIAPGVARVELMHAVHREQAQSVEDVIRRRLEIEQRPGNGAESLDMVIEELKSAGVTNARRDEHERRLASLLETLGVR